MKHISIYSFDASGNRVVVADARQSALTPSRVAALLIRSNLSALLKFAPEIYAVVSKSSSGVRADFWNPDSTRERVCGNALRCLPFMICRPDSPIDCRNTIETQHGSIETYITGVNKSAAEFPFSSISIEHADDGNLVIDPGTPHRVCFVTDLRNPAVSSLGKAWSQCIEPVNATFVKISNDRLEVRTFERGVGETKSCGTAAVSAFLAYKHKRNLMSAEVKIIIRFNSGEQLLVSVDNSGTVLKLEGVCTLLSVHTLGLESDESFSPNEFVSTRSHLGNTR